ncbi:hypothetical protein LCGC14_0248770 [marine sediment metagenome]|uniref:Uncharacterized protein n=1 Tax=marine sediment metagenome TaxID=412755 RepID=A0A0F9U527_9ZZZZ
MLTSKQIHLILNLISEKYGAGYVSEEDHPKMGGLQATLSVMLEVALKR